MPAQTKKIVMWGGALLLALLALYWIFNPAPAAAADLGGNCCADLEERIAELESSVARKGNKKVTVTVTGQISKALVYYDFGEDLKDWSVGENSNAPSYVEVSGVARIGNGWTAGYVAQIGLGGYESTIDPIGGNVGYGHINGGGTNELYLRKSFLYVEGGVGKFALGHLSQATDEIMTTNTSNAGVASTPLSLRPLIGPNIGEALDIFDGARADAVRYDSPALAGFMLSASVTPETVDSTGDTDGVSWDVAIRYAKELGEFKVAAAVGYRDGVVIPNDDLFGAIKVGATLGDIRVYSGSASVMHIPTGLFVTAAAGHLDFSDYASGAPNLQGWSVQGGVEERWGSLGKTTVFAEYGLWDLGSDVEPSYLGLGVVQAIDAAAMDIYVSGRRYELEDITGEDATVGMAGARVRF